MDLIFPHHEDEIAQSCAYTGRDTFARYWLHGEFLKIRGEKMSKRYGNITTARDLREDGVDPGAIRLLMFQVHYRQKLDLTDEALAAASEGARRLGEFRRRLRESVAVTDAPEFLELADRLDRERRRRSTTTSSAPRRGGAVRIRERGECRARCRPHAGTEDSGGMGSGGRRARSHERGHRDQGHWRHGVNDGAPTDLSGNDAGGHAAQQGWAQDWAVRRKQAKSERNFAEADRIRDRLKAAGWEVRDGTGRVGGGREDP